MTVDYAVNGRRATVRLDRPDVTQRARSADARGARAAFPQAAADDRVGVVVLTGTGERAFCTGADLREQEAFLGGPNDYWAWMGRFIAAIDAIRDCPKPVVARLNGIVVGGGNELNLACDLAVGRRGRLHPPRRAVARQPAAGGATQWLPIFARRSAGARDPAAQPRRSRRPRRSTGASSTASCPARSWTPPSTTTATGCSPRCRRSSRATRAQLDFWKDLSWSLTIRMAREWLTLHAASDEVRRGWPPSRRSGPSTTRSCACASRRAAARPDRRAGRDRTGRGASAPGRSTPPSMPTARRSTAWPWSRSIGRRCSTRSTARRCGQLVEVAPAPGCRSDVPRGRHHRGGRARLRRGGGHQGDGRRDAGSARAAGTSFAPLGAPPAHPPAAHRRRARLRAGRRLRAGHGLRHDRGRPTMRRSASPRSGSA